MKEADIIAKTDAAFGTPITRGRIVADLHRLGIASGDILLVHSSLSSVGWISGGAETLIRSLLEAVGKSGTLVMPAHSGHLSNPDDWEHPPVPDTWKQVIRDTMPAFDPAITETRGMGRVPELFRRFPGVIRSRHPMDSFVASGQKARKILDSHALVNGLGEESPLARLYDLGARVLLIGCGYDNNTSMHLAEHRTSWSGRKTIHQGSPIIEGRKRKWATFDELDYDADDFARCGEAFEHAVARGKVPRGDGKGPVRPVLVTGRIGLAESRLMSQRAIVDFAAEWMAENRGNPKNSPENVS